MVRIREKKERKQKSVKKGRREKQRKCNKILEEERENEADQEKW